MADNMFNGDALGATMDSLKATRRSNGLRTADDAWMDVYTRGCDIGPIAKKPLTAPQRPLST